MNPDGRAILKSCDYRVPYDGVSEEYPFHLTTGRNHLHFHTRTKTGRSSRLNKADPHPYVQVHEEDAEALGVKVSIRRFKLLPHRTANSKAPSRTATTSK